MTRPWPRSRGDSPRFARSRAIIVVIAFFQIVVLQQPFPNLGSITVGLLCVIAGLTLFIQGLESGLFPLGEALAQAFARKGSATALLGFAFCLGFATTVAEPALIAVAAEAAEVASQAGAIADRDGARTEVRIRVAPWWWRSRSGRPSCSACCAS